MTDSVNYLEQFETKNFSIRVGNLFNQETGEMNSVKGYHLINNRTMVVEYQSPWLVSCLQMMEQFNRILTAFEEENENKTKFVDLIH